MNTKKMLNDFLKAGGPTLLSGLILGLTYLSSNFDSYFDN